MSNEFLPSDRWGKHLTDYTSDTKKREQYTNVLWLGAWGCAALVLSALAYIWLFPTYGHPLMSSASHLLEELQGLREQNALLRAHLVRLARTQEEILGKGISPQHNQTVVTTMRKLLAETTDVLGRSAGVTAAATTAATTGATAAVDSAVSAPGTSKILKSVPVISSGGWLSAVKVGQDVFHGLCQIAYNVKDRVVNGPPQTPSQQQHRTSRTDRYQRGGRLVTQSNVGQRNQKNRLYTKRRGRGLRFASRVVRL